MQADDIVNFIRSSLSGPPPYASGTCPIPLEQFIVFYDVDGSNSRKINLAEATPEELGKLTDACQPATFGVNNEDVYDELYRKAGKMDYGKFSALLDVIDVGLIDVVRRELLEGENEAREIKVEMYKLNVYGKDSFFKPHKDTPRDKTMFGSLVVVFPTSHEGGEFVLHHDNKECVVDFAKTISEAGQQPCVGYVAFFSDVEHEVLKVRSGQRVTLTYNLYFTNKTRNLIPSISVPAAHENAFLGALYALMSDPTVLPDGGHLGFGLRHQYPVEEGMYVGDLRLCLKGRDAMLGRILSALDVTWDIRVFYDATDACYLSKSFVCVPEDGQVEGFEMMEWNDPQPEFMPKSSLRGRRFEQPLAEVTKMESATYLRSSYIAYGNECSLGWLYGHVCIVVDLPKLAKREICRPNFGNA